VVELLRADVQAARDGQAIPVWEITVNKPTSNAAGTAIQIHNLVIQNPDPVEVRS
jgi:hypothetical protein